MTTDHSIIQILLDSGKITHDEIREHPMRSIVTSSIGSGTSGFKVEPSWIEQPAECSAFIQLDAGDTILLTSDGLHAMLDGEFLSDLVARFGPNPEELVEKAVSAALDAGGEDNISIIAIHVLEVAAADCEEPCLPITIMKEP
jgi:protein phosphatase